MRRKKQETSTFSLTDTYRVVIKSAPENAFPSTKCMPTVNMQKLAHIKKKRGLAATKHMDLNVPPLFERFFKVISFGWLKTLML